MSDKPVLLRLNGVNKSYPVYKSNLHRFARWFGLPVKPVSAFQAVKDVSFELHQGETLGLIGENGAGKSTTLKLITGTVRPSAGQIEIGGRISAILELGLGFNPEFSGRENVYHSGGMMGFSPAKLDELMPEIEAFAEIGEHFDESVRTYSSGMQARLAFSLATAVRPEILIVDEVLSVGDAYFQHKSFARIRKFREEGSTIIIVSHSLGDVRELCDRVILMDHGEIVKDGEPDLVIDYYNAVIADKENKKLSIEQRRKKDGWLHTEFGDFRARMDKIELYRKAEDQPVRLVSVGDELEVRCRIKIEGDVDNLVLGHRISDRTGHQIWGSNTFHHGKSLEGLKAGDVIQSVLTFNCDLGPGSYALHFGLHSNDTHLEDCYHKAENHLIFEVVNTDQPYFIGTNNLKGEFSISKSNAEKLLEDSNTTHP